MNLCHSSSEPQSFLVAVAFVGLKMLRRQRLHFALSYQIIRPWGYTIVLRTVRMNIRAL